MNTRRHRALWGREPQRVLRQAQRSLATDEARIIAAEVPPPEEERRERAFLLVYVTLIALAILAFTALALTVRGDEIVRVDILIARAVQGVHLPLYGWILSETSALGWFPLNAVSYAAIFVVFAGLRRPLEAVLAVGASLAAGGLGQIVRNLVGRARPAPSMVHVAAPLSGYSFPSGHVIQYVTLFGFSFYLVIVLWRSNPVRNVVLFVLAAPVVLVGPSRVYLGQHWPSDVIGAYLFAGVWLAGTIELYRLLKHHFESGGPRWQEITLSLHRHINRIRNQRALPRRRQGLMQ